MADEFQRWALPTKQLGKSIHIYDRLESTNTLALSLGHDPTQHGRILLAREQTAGRGQYGRVWQAPPGSSVLMSVLLFPPAQLRRPALLTAWAAVSVCETILQLAKLQAKIKWPNDVLIHGKKVCGILIEQRTGASADFPLVTVVGVGLNITQSAEMFEQAGLPLAASLASVSGLSFTFENVAKDLIRQLDEQYDRLLEGDVQTLEALWKWRLGLLGRVVTAEGVQQRHRGRLLDVTFDGLDLEVNTGEVLHLMPESVKHLLIAD
jgi:BirA family biotin operon repressor/biotin-[acetyl-CoA-carboxylase] ligase